VSQVSPPYIYCVGADSAALGKPCGVCAAPFRAGERITLAVLAERPATAVGVHTACLPPAPSRT